MTDAALDEPLDEEDADGALPVPPAIGGAAAAAILLMLLEEEPAADILARLDPDDVRALGRAMYAAADAREAEVEAALDRFVVCNRDVSALAVGADPHIRKVMTRALGNVRADTMLADIAPRDSARAIGLLRWMEEALIAELLADEHPQVGALVLAALPPDVAARALAPLADEARADLVARAARLAAVSADALTDLEAILETYAARGGTSPRISLGGRSDMAQIVNKLPRADGLRMLKLLKKLDKGLCAEIEDAMLVFDDFAQLDDKNLGALVRAIDGPVLALALKGAAGPLAERMLAQLSSRAADTIRDEMAERGPVRRAEVAEAQRSVIATARALAADGSIMLGGQADDYV